MSIGIRNNPKKKFQREMEMFDLIGSAYNLDIYIFYIINLSLQNPFFNFLMPLITTIGSYVIWIVICVILAIFGGEKGRNVAIILFIAIIFGHIISEVLKYIILRPRPYEVLQGVHQMAFVDNESFPSGHATSIFIGCVILGKKYGYMILFLILAFIVSFSRIYLGVHYPSDVIAGALLGVGISLIVLHYENNILKLKNWFVQR